MHIRQISRTLGLTTAVLLAIGGAGSADAVSLDDTRLLQQPAVSESHIAFIYAGDLWIADRPSGDATRGVLDAGQARRLTSHEGFESNPRFSPDGQWLAFSAEYDGNRDVYRLPISGGVAERLTWHPDTDTVQGFTPDGAAVLFTSPRYDYARRYDRLFTVSVDGGFPVELPVPHAANASYSPDGTQLVYNPLGPAHLQWKNYRGGRVSRVWIYNVADHGVQQVPQPEGRSNDADPFWLGDTVYLRSDRHGEFNLFSYDPASQGLKQLTEHDDFPVLHASAGGGRIVYEQAGYLHLFDPAAGSAARLKIGVASDLVETRLRWESGGQFVRSASLSPTGARAAFGFRGEVVTVPAKKGNPRIVSGTPGAHEREPVWSPDGQHLAYFSDASGEYTLDIKAQDGQGDVKSYPLPGAGFYDRLQYSPDGTHLSFTDNSWALYLLTLETGEVKKLAEEPLYGPVKTLSHAWSPDSRWIAYTLNTLTYFQQIHLYSLDTGEDHVITDGLADVGEPVFDRSGRYLYFSASTDAGPVRSWFAMSNADMEITNSLYLAVLRQDDPSPLAAESDEEAAETDDEASGEGEGDETDDDDKVRIDVDGLAQRIVALPVASGVLTDLAPGKDGELYYLAREETGPLFFNPPGSLHRFDLKKRSSDKLTDGVAAYWLSADASKVLLFSRGQWSISGTGKIDGGALDMDSIRVQVDPRAEWPQIYDEAWRINRDYFYDPGMHGADWPAMKVKYAQFLPHLTSRDDLNLVIQWLCSELAVGHHRVVGGDRRAERELIPGGLLGADFSLEDGRYRFAKVYGGLNWNPDLRAPLTEPGVGVEAGEYVLTVNGVDLTAADNIYRLFENTAGQLVELRVGPSADGTDARTVTAVPIRDEIDLRNRDWVESNIRKVDEATDGRVAYVHVPNTATAGHEYFKRYFFPQAHKDAIIVDERHNGGGQIADYYIDILRRPHITDWAFRYGGTLSSPLSAIHGPKVMLINETAGSGGDLLPWMFRKLELGTLVGRPTWGGLVGILGFPPLMDGGNVTAPNVAIWTEEGFVVENVGVPPDVEVEQWPAEVAAGRDPQLEKAIEIALEQLEANPPEVRQQPPFPIRARR
ncbi:MAG: PDZ domain-containing protein [Acidobacteriota bacterium]